MISVTVMAHPKREAWVPELVSRLDAEAQVVWDERNDRWDTGRRALLAHDPKATHHLVIQDDAIPCRDLTAGLAECVGHVPEGSPLALYIGKVRPSQTLIEATFTRARRQGASFVRMEGPWWGVGIVLPTDKIAEAVAWGDAHPEVQNYDRRLSRFFLTKRSPCYYTVPSLVEHRHGTENPSLIPGRNSPSRKAWWFLGENRSALDVDWSAGVLRVGFGDELEDHSPIELTSKLGTKTVDRRVWDLIEAGLLIEVDGEPMLMTETYYRQVFVPKGGRR